MAEIIYRNINSKDLIEYDSKLKTYINDKINASTSYYKQIAMDAAIKVQDLTLQLEKALNRIDDLENNITTAHSNTYDVPIIDNPINKDDDNDTDNIDNDASDTLITPMLRSVPMVRSVHPEEPIVVAEDIEEDYVVYDRIISPYNQAVYKNIIVTTDDRSNRIWFSMWKTFDDRPLIDKQISIIWINAEGLKGESICTEKSIIANTDRLYFAWDIPSSVTVKAGTIRFAIRITAENYAWHTLPAEIQCVQGLMDGDWEETPDAVASVSWADYIEDQWSQLLVICDYIEYAAIPVKEPIVYVVTQQDNSVKMYLGTTEISSSGGGGSGRELDIRYNTETYWLEKKYSDDVEWTQLCYVPPQGNINNIVSLTTQEYADLETIDPTTLYLLKD